MPRYMFDTNMCIYLIKKTPVQVTLRFQQCYKGDVIMSAITYAELEYGVAASREAPQKRRDLLQLVRKVPIVPFDAGAASAYGTVRLATRDRKSDQLDKLIAAHAISSKVILVTNNERDFMAYPALRIENWVTGWKN